MSKEVMKIYELPCKPKELAVNDLGTIMKFDINIAFEEITKEFSKKVDEEVSKWLYEKYKETDVSKVYVLSKTEFEKYLCETLPKYKHIKELDRK